jgi:hypothetical protein
MQRALACILGLPILLGCGGTSGGAATPDGSASGAPDGAAACAPGALPPGHGVWTTDAGLPGYTFERPHDAIFTSTFDSFTNRAKYFVSIFPAACHCGAVRPLGSALGIDFETAEWGALAPGSYGLDRPAGGPPSDLADGGVALTVSVENTDGTCGGKDTARAESAGVVVVESITATELTGSLSVPLFYGLDGGLSGAFHAITCTGNSYGSCEP